MDVAIVAPCPIPYTIGGAENLCRWMQHYINERTEHQAEVIKLPCREHGFWPLIDAYTRFAELDLTGFDTVVSMKYPSWMVQHREHVVYLLHPLRLLYDIYPRELGVQLRNPPRPVMELLDLMDRSEHRRDVLGEVFDRLEDMRVSERSLPSHLFAFPGPFLRAVVRWLDAVGLHPNAIRRYGAISATVARREGYLPAGVHCEVVHPPTGVPALAPGPDRGYIFAASRLEEHKRVHLLVEAMRHAANPDARLLIAGTGPQEDDLREHAARDPRIEMLGRVSDERLADLYAHARAVAFVPEDEDYGLVTVEAMRCRRPVLTAVDSGGPTELVEHSRTGLVVEPKPPAIGAAIDALTTDADAARRMGEAAAERIAEVGWERVMDLIAGP
jgi:glycosyltransferase involved in cell wall biosynthesis